MMELYLLEKQAKAWWPQLEDMETSINDIVEMKYAPKTDGFFD